MDDARRTQLNSERLATVKPELAYAVGALIEALEAKGIKPLVTDAFRSVAQQNALYAQGRTKPGKIVTGLRGGQSKHNFGKAVDIAFVEAGGDVDWNMNSYRTAAPIAKQLGLIWGGTFKKRPDYPHYEIK